MISHDEAVRLIEGAPEGLDDLLARAASVRDAHGRVVTFSAKVFVPLTTLCRDDCGYCTFRRDPGQPGAHTMSPEEVVALCRAGARLGAKEALFSLGDRPEARFAEHREFLKARGHRTTLSYLRAVCAATLAESALLPHVNPGLMAERDLAALREVSVSMGLMLETTSERLLAPGLNAWGAVSPRPPDPINPEKPWPGLAELRRATEATGFVFRERLAVYPAFATRPEFVDETLRARVAALIDADGLVREPHEYWRRW